MPFRAEQLDEPYAAAEARTVAGASAGSPRCSGRTPTATSRAGVAVQRGDEPFVPVIGSRWSPRTHSSASAVALDPALEHVHHGRADERRDEDVVGLVVDGLRRGALLEDSLRA